MDNIVTYAENFFKSFDERSFNEVDSLILSWLSYLRYPDEPQAISEWDGVCIRDIFHAEIFEQIMHNVWDPEKTLELLTAVVASPRFRNIKIFGYEHEIDFNSDKQFAAVTFQLSPMLYYVAYRGTDATFVGWKEDMNLALEKPVSSQLAAVEYLEKAASKLNGEFMTGGHSKGGNLAVYAAAKCSPEVQKRITAVYSHDGPGFQSSFLEDEAFKQIQPVIHKTLPQSSLIGMIFEQECKYRIVKSNEISLSQHNPFSWEIRDGEFRFMEELTPDAKLLYKSLNNWIAGLNTDEREQFINAVFEILDETNVSDFRELGANLQQNLPIIAKKIVFLDADTKKFFLKLISQFAVSGVKSVPELFDTKHLEM